MCSSPSETTPLLLNHSPSGDRRKRFSPETLLIPVAFATTLAIAVPSTTFIEIQRQVICELWNITHGTPATLPAGGPLTPETCDRPEVVRYFATVTAILDTVDGIMSMAVFGILSRIFARSRKKPVFLLIIITRITGSCLIPGSQYVPRWLAAWFLLVGMLFERFSGLLPYGYLLHVYVVDVCAPEKRTIALSQITGWASLGLCVSFSLGGFITTRSGNPMIVFYVAGSIFLAVAAYIIFVLPESLPREKPRVRQERSREGSLLSSFLLVFAPLKTFIPTDNWRLTWCGLHILVFMSGHTYSTNAWLVLATSKYHLSPVDTGLFLTSVSVSGAIVLTFIVPSLIPLLRPYYTRRILSPSLPEEGANDTQQMKSETSDRLEVHLAVLACVVAGVFFITAALSKTNVLQMVFSGICLGFTSVHGPTIRSLVIGSVNPRRQSEVLAGIEMVTKAGVVLSSVTMGSVLTQTIETAPLLFFYIHLAVVLISCVPLFLVRDSDKYRESET